MSIKNRADWLNHYNELEVEIIETLLEDNKDVTLYKCECCDKWSAMSSDYEFILLPISELNILDACNWIKENDFKVKFVIIDNELVPVEHVNIGNLL